MIQPRYAVSVAGFVRDDAGRVLLRRGPEGWGLPHLEVGLAEDILTALKRGVFEQTGCRVRVGKLIGLHSSAGFPPKLVMTFSARLVAEAPEGTAHFYSEADALTLVRDGPQLDALLDAIGAQGVTYRKYVSKPYLVQLEAVI
jgi:ADP-ribose pyrophosphatase YjhB (NUDIX family)